MSNPADDTPEVTPLDREVGDWEKVSNGLHSWTQRKAVPGGWLYRTVVHNNVAICFVPDATAGQPADEEATQA